MSQTESDLKTAIQEAVQNAQAANEAMNQIDQSKLPAGVWSTLYAQNEAISALGVAVLILAGPQS